MRWIHGGRWHIFYPESLSNWRQLGETVCEGPCLECFGIPHGSVLLIDLARAPKVGDFAMIEIPEIHEVTGSRLQAKRLGMRRLRVRDTPGAFIDVAICESVTPPYPLELTDRILGTVVAAIIPPVPIVDVMLHATNAHIDSFIRQANALRPQLKWKRPPAVSL